MISGAKKRGYFFALMRGFERQIEIYCIAAWASRL
jgi:hypothetical protein